MKQGPGRYAHSIRHAVYTQSHRNQRRTGQSTGVIHGELGETPEGTTPIQKCSDVCVGNLKVY